MLTKRITNTYFLEIGIKLIFIEGCCGIADYSSAALLHDKFYPRVSRYSLEKEKSLFKQLVEDIVINKTVKIEDAEAKRSGLNKVCFDAIGLFLGRDCLSLGHIENNCSLILDGIGDEDINQCLYTFLKYKKDFQILFLWPSTLTKKTQRKKAIDDITTKMNVFYSLTLKLNKRAFYQLFYLLYYSFDWAKPALNQYSSGFVDKVYKCSAGRAKGSVVVYFVDDDLEKLLEFKRETLRDYFKIGFHSAHSCDNKIEALPIAQLLLNKNGLQMLCYSDFSKNNKAIEEMIDKKNDTCAYSEELYHNILGGITVVDLDDYKIKIDNLKWNNSALFYNSSLVISEENLKLQKTNPYAKFLRKYKFIKVKSHISNTARKIIGRE